MHFTASFSATLTVMPKLVNWARMHRRSGHMRMLWPPGGGSRQQRRRPACMGACRAAVGIHTCPASSQSRPGDAAGCYHAQRAARAATAGGSAPPVRCRQSGGHEPIGRQQRAAASCHGGAAAGSDLPGGRLAV